MDKPAKKIWFPAKRYGWGWGPPNCWQGWMVIGLWTLLIAAGVPLAKPSPYLYLGFILVMIAGLMTVCYLKGEKPRWRWGKD